MFGSTENAGLEMRHRNARDVPGKMQQLNNRDIRSYISGLTLLILAPLLFDKAGRIVWMLQ